MGYFSDKMGLRIWDLSDDDFSRSELANNFEAIDDHDHTAGKGTQIPGAGLQDNSITAAKFQDGSVTTNKLATDAVTQPKVANAAIGTAELVDLNVTTIKLADGAVTAPKLGGSAVGTTALAGTSVTEPKVANDAVSTRTILDTNVTEPKLATNAASTRVYQNQSVTQAKLANGSVGAAQIQDGAIGLNHLNPNLIPVGTVIPWWRPSDLTAVPSGWVVPTGQTLLDADHDFAEGTSIQLPDLRNRFILGAATTGTGGGTGSPPPIGGVGGAHTANLAHSHTVDSHSHAVASHTHSIAAHAHVHFWWDNPVENGGGGNQRELRQRGSAVYGLNPLATKQALYVPDLNRNEQFGEDVGAQMVTDTHSHGGATGAATPGTAAATPGTDSQLSATTDLRPGHIGLLFLMKVKNS